MSRFDRRLKGNSGVDLLLDLVCQHARLEVIVIQKCCQGLSV